MRAVKMKKETLAHGRVLDGLRIGIFGKGGSGKSTIAVLLATGLRERGYSVIVLDADSTNIGLSQALGTTYIPRPLLAYFGGMVFSGGLVTCPVDDPTPLPGSDLYLDDLPTSYRPQSPQGITLLEAGKIGALGPGAGCDGPVAKIARDLHLKHKTAEPVTLVDFKAGFEDVARGVITRLDWAIVVVDPTLAAVQMAVNMRDMVAQIRKGARPATQHLESAALVEIAERQYAQASIKGVLFLLNKIEDRGTEAFLQQRLAAEEITTAGSVHADHAITQAWLQGRQLESRQADGDIQMFIDTLETKAQETRLHAAQVN
jgi:CO dehydrogenase nickel-insertion accessory protein CooC1